MDDLHIHVEAPSRICGRVGLLDLVVVVVGRQGNEYIQLLHTRCPFGVNNTSIEGEKMLNYRNHCQGRAPVPGGTPPGARMRGSPKEILSMLRKCLLPLAVVPFCALLAWPQNKLSVHWEELTAPDFVRAIGQSQATCLLPFGILEKHGPHLP